MTILACLLHRRPPFPDPRYCRYCGTPLERREGESFDPYTGMPIPRPYAACPRLRIRYLGEGSGGWEIGGAWPEHTFIQREPRWEPTP